MSSDEEQIRAVVERWMQATLAGDAETILDLMTDDVVFCTVGNEPFGKEAFAALSRANDSQMSIEGSNEIVELQVLGDWAFTRNHIDIRMRQGDGAPVRRSGYTLTLFRREADGRWRLARDANLLTGS
jgi:conserved hypothetical protein